MAWPGTKRWAAGTGAALAATACLSWIVWPGQLDPSDLRTEVSGSFEADPKLGEVLYHLGGCTDCHAAVGNDGHRDELPAGGLELKTAFGTFLAPNITPDRDTGIGGWTDAEFVDAMRNGVSPDGKHYYPAFPYTSYAEVTTEDLLHLKAYLDSLPPVSRPSQEHELSFPFNVRPGNAFWKLVAHRKEEFVPDPSMSDSWNRGAYLVNGLGHCGVCHSPRNVFFAEDTGRLLEGAPPLKVGDDGAPRIAGIEPDKIRNALDEWSFAIDEDSPMYAVTLAFSNHASSDDIEAIVNYLSSLDGAD